MENDAVFDAGILLNKTSFSHSVDFSRTILGKLPPWLSMERKDGRKEYIVIRVHAVHVVLSRTFPRARPRKRGLGDIF
jgi:hypothetical protein